MNESQHWYALTVKHQHEQPLAGILQRKGFEAFTPTYRTRRQWSDRSKELELPLFSGYVFCRFGFFERSAVLDTPGVARIVGFGGNPAPISNAEMEAIHAVTASRLPARPWPHLKPGDRVRIDHGPLRGIEGTLLKEKDRFHLVIGIELLQRSIAVELDADAVAPERTLRASA